MLRVKNGPCAPLRFISMLSRPATGTTRSSVTIGVAFDWDEFVDMRMDPVELVSRQVGMRALDQCANTPCRTESGKCVIHGL
ncbi:hypothetical protein GCM10011400_47670 [Paraburkholderia caffeinilytica]|uniref:Uncharacterized protein n=1 Tax=Paraburkholderia caffeinilytica TaxID=1761016 RepID=A0ABQ1N592_9BURK|nr:hypothetical protein GCM10011400_47670 [Paraburkholderia caffeinilytica]